MSRADYTTFVHDRSDKVAARRGRQKVNGIALKRLLIERAAKAAATKHTTKGTPSQ